LNPIGFNKSAHLLPYITLPEVGLLYKSAISFYNKKKAR